MEATDKNRIRLDKKNLSRRQHTQQARAAIFVSEYIKEKHRETYEEAVAFYNYVNELHPKKNNLIKTHEFKAMKNGILSVVKQPKIIKQTFKPIPTTVQHEIAVINADEQSSTEQAETVASSAEQAKTMQLCIPLMSTEQVSTTVLEESLRTSLLHEEIQATLDQEIPEEIYGKILEELRADPDLANLMEDMEQDFHEQGIDLPIEEDRLELELQNWGMW